MPAVPVGTFATEPEIEISLHDFGVVSLSYRLALSGPLDSLVELSCALYDNPQLRADSRRHVEGLLAEIRAAVTRPSLFEESEDYVVYEIAALEPPGTMEALLTEHGDLVARILRSERQALSAEEVADAKACRTAYGTRDLALVDWNAAMLFDHDAHDVRAVLEFANLELLELRLLDRQLDEALVASHEMLRKPLGWIPWPGAGHREASRVAQLQMDGVVLFEEVNNALKLLGDQYLARVYRLASQRFHLGDWDTAILRKLETLESVHQKLSAGVSSRRLELLEWIIILLIAVSIVLPFLGE